MIQICMKQNRFFDRPSFMRNLSVSVPGICVSYNGAYYGVLCEIDLEMDVHFIPQEKWYVIWVM